MKQRKPMSDDAVQALVEREAKWTRFVCCTKCDNIESRKVTKQATKSCRLCGGQVNAATLEGMS